MYHIADFIIRIKNASAARRSEVVMPYSNSAFAIAKLLVKQGFLGGVKEQTIEGKRQIVATVRYVRRRAAVNGVEVISKPSLRVYADKKAVSQEKNSMVTAVLSTSQGIMTEKDAIKKGVGGELLFRIW